MYKVGGKRKLFGSKTLPIGIYQSKLPDRSRKVLMILL